MGHGRVFFSDRPERTDIRATAKPPPASAITVTFAVVVAALYFGREVFVPLALAILLSFVLAPVVRLLRRLHVARVPSALVAVLMAVVVIVGIGVLMGGQIAQLAENLPQYQSTIEQKIQVVRGTAAGSSIVARASSMFKDLRTEITKAPEKANEAPASSARSSADQQQQPIPVEIREPPLTPLQLLQAIVGPLLAPLATTGIVIIFLMFILLQREDLRDRFIRLAGARDLHRTTRALDDGAYRLRT